MSETIKDKTGKVIGYKTKMYPSGDTVVVYPKRLQTDPLQEESNRYRRVALGLWDD